MSRFLLILSCLLASYQLDAQTTGIHWMSFTEAMEASKTERKKILIDFYTDWCGWCKKMDASTFSDPKVAEYINANYYAVKFNAEKEGPITVGDTTYAIIPNAGRNGTHGMAITLLNGKMSYPSFVFLDEYFNLLSPLQGYHTSSQLEAPLKYFGDNAYKTMNWTQYQQQFKGTF